MSLQVDYQDKPGYLFVHVTGERSLEAVITLLKDVSKKAINLQYERLLIDVRDFTGWLKTMENYNIVTQEFPKYRGKGIRRVAILDREIHVPVLWNFFETVAQNRGFNLRIFTDLNLAIDWVVEDLDNQPPKK